MCVLRRTHIGCVVQQWTHVCGPGTADGISVDLLIMLSGELQGRAIFSLQLFLC